MSRITNAMLTNNYLGDLQTNLRGMSTLQSQLSSGSNIQRASDDVPVATKIMQLNSEISANKQFNTNITDATNWLDTTDTALSESGNVLSRIRQLMVKAGDGSYGEDEISSIKNEVTSAVSELGQTLNTSFDGNYIFGGTKSTSKPVTVDGNGNMSYADAEGNAISKDASGDTTLTLSDTNTIKNGSNTIQSITKNSDGTVSISYNNGSTTGNIATSDISSALTTAGFSSDNATSVNSLLSNINNTTTQIGTDLTAEISDGVKVNYNVTASSLLEFKDSSGTSVNAMSVLSGIISDLGTASSSSSSSTQKSDALTKINGTDLNALDSVINNFLTVRSKVGTMQNRMESATTTNEDQNSNMTNVLSNAADIDVAEKTIEYSTAQTIYKAALQVSSTVLTKTIMDYL